MTDGLRLALLGGFRASLDGAPLGGFVSSKVQALLCYLAVTGRPHSRDALAGLLWGEMQEEAASANLRVALSNLRRLLPNYLIITRQTLAFNRQSPFWLDVDVFQSNVQLAQTAPPEKELDLLRQAINLYSGEFLEGFFVREAPSFEEWVLGQRERMRRLALQTLYTLTARSSARGEYDTALGYTSRLLSLEPWQEEAHRQMMLLLALSGQRSAALAQYEICRTVLAQELGVEPMDETTALYTRIREGRIGEPAEAEQFSVPMLRLHNLPDQLTPFIGRETELAQIATRLTSPSCRLLTLVGPGGIGKTRLALQAATDYLSNFSVADGICFVPLAGVVSGEFLVSTIADALGFSFYSSEDPRTQLLNYLREKQLLLILDSFEHLRSETSLVIDILLHARNVKLLITSRERLHIGAEHLLDIEGLPYPANAQIDGAEGYSAVQLFAQSAERVWAGFSLSPANLPAVIRICQLVEGMPLAIELAAAWVRDFSCDEIVAEIERNLDFLKTSLQDVPQRHQSLRAVFDHSWTLLSPEERQVFQRLAVFRGGFRREAALPIADASPEVLSALGDKSLLRRISSGRYEVHELLRQYAEEKLSQIPHELTETYRNHASYYAAFLSEREQQLKGWRQKEALEEIGAEIENVRNAWQWAVAQGEEVIIEQSMESLFHFYDMRSWFAEGADVFSSAVGALAGADLQHRDRGGESARTIGRLLARQGWFLFHLGDHSQARMLLQRSLALLHEHGAVQDVVFSLNYLGAVSQHLGSYQEASELLHKSLAISERAGNRFDRSIALNILGVIASSQGEYAEARQRCQESLAIKRKIGDRWGAAFSLTNLGAVAYALNEYAEAQRLFQESLTIRREMGDRRGIALCLNHLGDVARSLGDYREAVYLYEQSLAIFEEIGNRLGMIAALKNLGDVTYAVESYEESRHYFQQALQIATEIEAPSRALDIVTGMAALLAKEGRLELAVELATLSLKDQVSTLENRQRAEQLLNRLASQLSPDLMVAAQQRALDRTIDTVVRELVS
ncbi:MAG: transcriptional activator [Herpetosiphonaceae bacterium]|nr:MAG: transcriptional activator [Herpetosiphonaceae bacterium]